MLIFQQHNILLTHKNEVESTRRKYFNMTEKRKDIKTELERNTSFTCQRYRGDEAHEENEAAEELRGKKKVESVKTDQRKVKSEKKNTNMRKLHFYTNF